MSAPTADTTSKKNTPAKVEPTETNRERFVRLAQLRTSNALDSIRKIGLLGNKAQYQYEDEDIAKIKQALDSAVDSAINSMESGRPSQSSFSLD